jgi:hypothetical protein
VIIERDQLIKHLHQPVGAAFGFAQGNGATQIPVLSVVQIPFFGNWHKTEERTRIIDLMECLEFCPEQLICGC